MSPATAELLFEVLNVGILAAGLGCLLFKPVRQALAAETQAHAARAEALDQRAAELAQATAALDQRRAEEEARLRAQAEATVAAAEAEARDRRAAAQAETEARRAAWASEQAGREAEAVRAEAAAMGQVAGQAVRELLARCAGPDLDLALARTALAALPAAPGPTRVELAVPPSPALQALLQERLPGGYDLVLRPELGAGLRVAGPGGLVDASAQGLGTQAAESVATSREPPRA